MAGGPGFFGPVHLRPTRTPSGPARTGNPLLHVADEATSLWQKTEEEPGEIGLPPPYWAFAWAGGQALWRAIVSNHPEKLRRLRVLDFASGSGLVAIAAAKAGAGRGSRRWISMPHCADRYGAERRCQRRLSCMPARPT